MKEFSSQHKINYDILVDNLRDTVKLESFICNKYIYFVNLYFSRSIRNRYYTNQTIIVLVNFLYISRDNSLLLNDFKNGAFVIKRTNNIFSSTTRFNCRINHYCGCRKFFNGNKSFYPINQCKGFERLVNTIITNIEFFSEQIDDDLFSIESGRDVSDDKPIKKTEKSKDTSKKVVNLMEGNIYIITSFTINSDKSVLSQILRS